MIRNATPETAARTTLKAVIFVTTSNGAVRSEWPTGGRCVRACRRDEAREACVVPHRANPPYPETENHPRERRTEH
jgi:hypothetical protein